MCSAWPVVFSTWFAFDIDSEPANEHEHSLDDATFKYVAQLPSPGSFFLHLGHFVMSSGHSNGATDAGSMQKLFKESVSSIENHDNSLRLLGILTAD